MERYFHSELSTLRTHITQMGSLAVDAVRKSVQAFLDNDIDLAEAVIAKDYEIDQLEIEIDHEANRYLTLRAPVASDLRILTVAIKASHDLERVGDEAKSIAKKTRRILNRKGVHSEFFRIEEMSEMVNDMINRALLSFIEEDADAARKILFEDDAVDRLNKSNVRSMVESAKDKPEDIDTYVDLIFISKSLERIADHSTNLAEEVIYFKTAVDARHHRAENPPEDQN